MNEAAERADEPQWRFHPDGLAWGIAGALDYDAAGDAGAEELQARIATQGIGAVMQAVCGISPDEPLGVLVLERYARLQRGVWIG